jgi:prenyltransferase beta subunit
MSSMAMLDKLHWIDGQKLTQFILQCQVSLLSIVVLCVRR